MRRVRACVLLLGVATACTGGGSAAPQSPSASPSSSVDPSAYAVFQLRPVVQVLMPSSPEWDSTPLSCPPENTEATACAASPDNVERIVLAGPIGSQERYVLGAAIVDAGDVSAAARLEGTSGEVSVALTPDGSDALAEATRVAASAASPGNRIAIVVNGRVVSAPVVQQPITSGQIIVVGLTGSGARLLSMQLNALTA